MYLVCITNGFQTHSELLTELESSSRSLSTRRQSSSAATNKAVEEEYNEEEDGDDGQGGDDGDGADDADDGGFGDDFDDFEEGEEDAEFGDFDDGFQEPEVTQSSLPIPVVPSFVSSRILSACNNITLSPNISIWFSPPLT